jgi:hypothetical protein
VAQRWVALQEAARAAVAEAAKDKAAAVSTCVQLELDAAELRERLARYERTQVRRRAAVAVRHGCA